ncbi:hypothetical protein ISP15_07390 [Dyella jejuensis]|uniref:Uncharacterized protein n=1 Tax=Dyella jejuensis TaxID=1432009 RepID=A0ABW8JK31_9GAMM
MQMSSRRAVLAAVLAVCMSGAAVAGSPAPSTGLGQAWPNAIDVSVNPDYHAYVFVLGGMQYIQINDLNGNVLGSVGTAGGQFITLPMGRFAQYVSTPQQPASANNNATPTASPAPVYDDGTTVITATPMSDASTQLKAAMCVPSICDAHGS